MSEDAVSSSCNEGKATRNAYVQTSRQGVAEIKVQRLISYINHLKEQSKAEIEQNKKKQWVRNCIILCLLLRFTLPASRDSV